ncbi:MAG: response regulator, partial [Planctomycetota bacterium]
MGAESMAAPLFLVDDEPDALQGMALTLQAHGLGPVRRIQDPRLALELLREEQPDCVVLDLTMPQLSG